jgi:hypothetical protein
VGHALDIATPDCGNCICLAHSKFSTWLIPQCSQNLEAIPPTATGIPHIFLRSFLYEKIQSLIAMYYSINLRKALLLVSTFATSQAFTVTYYVGTSCRSGAPIKNMQRPEQGFQNLQQGVSKSHLLTGDQSDASFYMVYFSDSECNPYSIIKRAELGKNWASTCVDVSEGYKSFQVYDVCTSPGCLNS